MCCALPFPRHLSPEEAARRREKELEQEKAEQEKWDRFIESLKSSGFKRLSRLLGFIGRERCEYTFSGLWLGALMGLMMVLMIAPFILWLKYVVGVCF